MKEYNTKLALAVKSYLEGEGWNFEFDEENGRFIYTLKVKSSIQNVRTVVNVLQRSIIVHGYPPLKSDEANLHRLAEYFTYCNYGLNYGNFELDFRDGEVRFKTSLFCGDDIPTKNIIEVVVDTPTHMWDRYGNGFTAILYAGALPKDEAEKADTQYKF